MKVKCILEVNNNLPEGIFQPEGFNGYEYALFSGKEYSVNGITIKNGKLYYFIEEDINLSPTGYPAEWFNITDSQLPQEWGISLDSQSLHNNLYMFLGDKSVLQ